MRKRGFSCKDGGLGYRPTGMLTISASVKATVFLPQDFSELLLRRLPGVYPPGRFFPHLQGSKTMDHMKLFVLLAIKNEVALPVDLNATQIGIGSDGRSVARSAGFDAVKALAAAPRGRAVAKAARAQKPAVVSPSVARRHPC